jgi:hypothetical protein
VISRVAISEGKKTEEGTMMSISEPLSNPVAVTDPPDVQTPMPATIEDALDVLTNGRIQY